MIYTIIFYLLIAYYSSRPDPKALKWACIVAAIYYGIRYNYMPDYMAYMAYFERVSSPSYIYDPDYEHFEIGWYLLNKAFVPIGYFPFVFICSCVFAFGVYSMVKCLKIDQKYLPIVLFGFFTLPALAVLSSAQRQFFVAGVFMIAYRYLLYEKLTNIKSLYSKTTLLYFVIVYICSTFHSSAIFLVLVPFLSVIPIKSKFTTFIVVVFFLAFISVGSSYLPILMGSYIEQTETYDYLSETLANSEIGGATLLATLMYAFQIYFFSKALSLKDLNRDEAMIILVALLCVALNISSYYVQQLYRIAMYMSLFTYLTIPLIATKMPKSTANIFYNVMLIWIIWNSLKIISFAPPARECDQYHTIFSVLF